MYTYLYERKVMMMLLKMLFTLYACIVFVNNWRSYGLQNFLWMSDIGFFLTVAAVWIESPLLISMCIASFLAVEILWNVDFFIALILGKKMTGLSDYMFESRYSLVVRSLSLFHVLLPTLWVGLAFYWGYDVCALYYAVPMIWITLIMTYLCTEPSANINWVFAPTVLKWKRVTQMTWLIIMLIGYPLLICWPTHMIFKYMVRVEKESCMT